MTKTDIPSRCRLKFIPEFKFWFFFGVNSRVRVEVKRDNDVFASPVINWRRLSSLAGLLKRRGGGRSIMQDNEMTVMK